MELPFNPEQKAMQEMVRDFAKNEITPYVESMEEGVFPHKLIQKMGELGLLGIPIDDHFHGSGMDFTSYIIAIHEISKVSPAIGVILSVHTSVGTNPIVEYGTEEQKNYYIPKLATGEYLGAFALTEPQAGSDVASMRTKADKEGEYYILHGTKVFITNGMEADTFIVFARTKEGESINSISAFIVEKDAEGLSIGSSEEKMGLHGTSTVTLHFDQCKIHQRQRLGEEGEGFKIAMSNLNVGRAGIAAQALGIAEGAFGHAKQYAKEREQFGKPIASHQGITFKLADMATNIEAAKLLVYRTAFLIDAGVPSSKTASMAKLMAAQTAREVAIDAVQIFGGYGYTKDYPVERYFRDAKVTEIYEGTNEIQKKVIAKEILQENKRRK